MVGREQSNNHEVIFAMDYDGDNLHYLWGVKYPDMGYPSYAKTAAIFPTTSEIYIMNGWPDAYTGLFNHFNLTNGAVLDTR